MEIQSKFALKNNRSKFTVGICLNKESKKKPSIGGPDSAKGV